MKEDLINFETAKLAKEKGFNIPSVFWYLPNNKLVENPFIGLTLNQIKKYGHLTHPKELSIDCFIAPTLSLLQKWLREKHDIEVFAKSDYKNTVKVGFYYGTDLVYSRPIYKTYEEALKKGLIEGLKLIK